MNASDQLTELLERFDEVGDETQALLAAENEQLQKADSDNDPTRILERKRELLEQLDEIVQQCRDASYSAGEEHARFVNRLQARYLKLLMLDRENERVLLQSTMPKQVPKAGAPVRDLAQAYHRGKPPVS